MKSKISSVLMCLAMFSSLESFADDSSTAEKFKKSSSGTGRFNGGFYGAIGAGSAIGSNDTTQIRGLDIELGVYGLFNPIKRFVDIEVGLNGKYITGMERSGNSSSTYYNGLAEVAVYGGPVFQFNGGKNAFGFGVSKALTSQERPYKDTDRNYVKNDISNGLGAYAEYQWVKETGRISFARLTVETFDVEPKTLNAKSYSQNVLGLVGGIKF